MGETTGISWCHHTFNIVIGCTKVSEACQFCYAEAMSKRMGLAVWGASAPRKVMSEKYWREPLKWNRVAGVLGERRRVFCSSMADVFEDHSLCLDTTRTDAGDHETVQISFPLNLKAA